MHQVKKANPIQTKMWFLLLSVKQNILGVYVACVQGVLD